MLNVLLKRMTKIAQLLGWSLERGGCKGMTAQLGPLLGLLIKC